ncbi:MAG TPA: hypothetical protein VH724_21035 [Candidatus Angelobacter sp.]|jgi:hypothetical protein|nr:hypothetical protein [Candidatus Angelobacter sp.]
MPEKEPEKETADSSEQSNRKAAIVEDIFLERWNPATGRLSNPLVTLPDLSKAIQAYNGLHKQRPLSDRNPANFFKDFIRNKRRANKNWPKKILDAGFTARQVTGAGRSFEFVRLADKQEDPFPLNAVPGPTENTPRFKIETISLPLASRRLGRKDEPWLVQVLVRLRIIETHLALFSSRKIIQLDHLQMNVKLSRSEIDALFLAIEELGENIRKEVLVTCEAKGRNDDILETQVLEQVRAAFRFRLASNVQAVGVLPMAIKAFAPSQIFVVEFESINEEQAEAATSLTVASSAIYELTPRIPGIGK